MKKILILLVLLIGCIFTPSYAEENGRTAGILFLNQTKIEHKDTVLFTGEVLFPLRTVMEQLGANVIWHEDTGNIDIVYKNKKYLCEIQAPNPMFPEIKYIYIKDSLNGNYLHLTKMSIGGLYTLINDRTYLYEETGIRLFEALGCTVEIDKEQKVVRITSH